MNYKVGVIGTGYGGMVHIPAFIKTQGYTVSGICDSGTGSAKKVKEKFNLDCEIYKNAHELISSKNIDLIDISSPPETHFSFLKKSLKYKKNVICEKPFGLSYNEIKNINFENKNLICAIGYQYRFERLMRILKYYADKDFLGTVKRIDVNWNFKRKKKNNWKSNSNHGGGIVDDLICHVVDYLSLFFGNKILNPHEIKFEGFIKKESCNIKFSYKDRTLSEVNVNRDSVISPSHEIFVYGVKKNAKLFYYAPFNSFSKRLEIFGNQKLFKRFCPRVHDNYNLSDDRIESFSYLLKRFLDKKKHYKLCNIEDGKKIRMILDEINKKLKK